MRKIVLFCLYIVVFTVTNGQALAVTSIDKLLDIAYTYNHNMIAASRSVELDRQNIDFRNLFPPPMIEIELRNGFGNSTATETVLSQTIPFPTKLSTRWDILHKQVDIGRYDYNMAKVKLTRQIKQAYYEYAINDKLLKLEYDNYRFLSILYKSEMRNYEMGYGSQIDLIDIKTKMINSSASAQEYVTAKYKAFSMLESQNSSPNPRILMQEGTRGFLEDMPVLYYDDKDIENIPRITKPMEELKNIAIANNPAYQKFKYEAKVASMSAEIAQATYLPDITVGFGQIDSPNPTMVEKRFIATFSLPWLWGSGIEANTAYRDYLNKYAVSYMFVDEITSSIDGKSTSAFVLLTKLNEYKPLLPLIAKQINQVNLIYSSQYNEPKALEDAYNQFMKVNNASKTYYDIYMRYINLILDVEELTGERIW